MDLDNTAWNFLCLISPPYVLSIHFVSVESPLVVKVIPVWLLQVGGINSNSCERAVFKFCFSPLQISFSN